MTEPSAPTGASSPFAVLTRKVGPLPGWAWLAIAVGGYAVYKMYQNRAGNVNQDTSASDTIIPSSAPVSDASNPVDGTGGVNLSGGIGGTQTTPVGPITNAQWAATAARGLIAQNPSQAVAITNALQKYVTGSKSGLTSAEQSIVTQAIAQFGPPPEGILPITSAAPAQSFTTYTTKKGDSFQSISTRYFGTPSLSGKIRMYNPGLRSFTTAAKLPVGRVIRIPTSYTYKAS